MPERDLHELTFEQLVKITRMQTEIITVGSDFERLKGIVAREVMTLTGADGAIIELCEGDEMVYATVAGLPEELVGLRLSVGTSISGLCIRSGETLRCDDCEQDTRVDREACRKVGLRSMLLVPLIHQGRSFGVLKAISREPSFFDDNDAALMRSLSRALSAALVNAAEVSTDELFQRATSDPLTGLANRAFLLNRAEHDLEQCCRTNKPMALFQLDLDRFKHVNDTYGHSVGDKVLKEAASRLWRCVRQADTLARPGGDEFAIVAPGIRNIEEAEIVRARIARAFEPPLLQLPAEISLGCSCGYAIYPDDGETIEDLIEVADSRMYADKRLRASQSA